MFNFLVFVVVACVGVLRRACSVDYLHLSVYRPIRVNNCIVLYCKVFCIAWPIILYRTNTEVLVRSTYRYFDSDFSSAQKLIRDGNMLIELAGSRTDDGVGGDSRSESTRFMTTTTDNNKV